MRLGDLKLGKSVEIYVVRDKYKLRLVSKIEDAAFDHIAVTLITGNGRAFQFQKDDKIEFIYKDEHRLWRWTRLTGTIEKLDGDYVHCFYGPIEGESFNRRNAYRIFLGEDIRFYWTKNEKIQLLLDHKEDIASVQDEELTRDARGILKDLSETGAGIYSNEKLNLQDAVSFRLITPFGNIQCIGKVVRMTEEGKGPYKHFAGISFVEVSNVISKYIFQVQRMQLQKHNK